MPASERRSATGCVSGERGYGGSKRVLTRPAGPGDVSEDSTKSLGGLAGANDDVVPGVGEKGLKPHGSGCEDEREDR